MGAFLSSKQYMAMSDNKDWQTKSQQKRKMRQINCPTLWSDKYFKAL